MHRFYLSFIIAATAIAQVQTRGLQSADLLKLRSVGDVQWSPDGARLLFLVRGGVSVAAALGGPSHAVVPPSSNAAVGEETTS